MRGFGRRLVGSPTAYSHEGVLGLLTANDLLWRALADVRWDRIPSYVESVGESALVSVTVSALVGLDAGFRMLALAAQWALLGYLFYAVAPRAFRPAARDLASERRFRLLTAGLSLGYALLLGAYLVGNPWPVGDATFGAGVGCLIVGTVLGYGTYFRVEAGWNGLTPPERVDLLERFVPVPADAREETIGDLSKAGTVGRAYVAFWKGAVIVFCLLPCFLFGVLAVLALGLYPLVELLIAGWVVTDAVTRRWDLPFVSGMPSGNAIDVEARLYDAVEHVGHGVKGMSTMLLLVFVGLFPQVLVYLEAFRLLSGTTLPILADALAAEIGTDAAVIAWNLLGLAFLPLGVAVYGTWFWLRMLRRAGPFLDAWGGADATARVARPVGSTAPPMAAFLAFVGYGTIDVPWVDPIYAIAWPLSLIALTGLVVLTRAREPQPPETDAAGIPLALLVQAVTLFGFGSVTAGGRLRLGPDPFGVFMVTVVPWFFFLGDVGRFTRTRGGYGRYALPAYLFLFGSVVSGLALAGHGEIRLALGALGVTILVGGTALAVEEYLSA